MSGPSGPSGYSGASGPGLSDKERYVNSARQTVLPIVSLEVGVQVTAENTLTGDRVHTNTAYLTFVAIDERGKPVPVPPVKPVTAEEQRRFEDAGRRRAIRLRHRRK